MIPLQTINAAIETSISRKVSTALKADMSKGLSRNALFPYGYR